MLMRVLQWVMTAAFVFSAAVQYNDPDPLPWIGIYGAAAAGAAWAALRPAHYPWWYPALVFAIALAWCARILPRVMGKVRIAELFEAWEMKNARVEEAREAGGLLIVSVWMAVTAAIALARARAGG
ncbi:MAG: hypothetical protein E6K80_08850 [Candidatus Eisenbacteria bacterium]|uniref:Uncharacterized protein n=1 Tax=Eiseniibacteriota bacterium TaxID=2212470 RepID=A0A538U3I1_UNCEI|nr:MAG: hypothetical protein E6K80_08850 [Candidatus Eisenbacteria bacterium]